MGRDGWRIWEQGNGYCEPTEAEKAEAARHWREELQRLENLREGLARHAARMAEFASQFYAGDKRALPHALCECVCSYPEKPAPEWARQELAKAMYAVTMARAASWDDVLGKPHSSWVDVSGKTHKGHQVEALRLERALSYWVVKRVLELRRQKPKPKDIFQKVADTAKPRISRAACKRYFERGRKTAQKRTLILNRT
jgi:hypothetical protein